MMNFKDYKEFCKVFQLKESNLNSMLQYNVYLKVMEEEKDV